MYEAWERYKDLLRKCPHHELLGWLQIQTFYNGLRLEHRAMVDATTGKSLMRRTPKDAYGLLDDMPLMHLVGILIDLQGDHLGFIA